MIFKNCTFFNENFEKEFGDIEIENGKIILINILGVKTELDAQIDCIDLMENIITVKNLA